MLLVGPGVIVGGKSELLGIREAASDGGLFYFEVQARCLIVAQSGHSIRVLRRGCVG